MAIMVLTMSRNSRSTVARGIVETAVILEGARTPIGNFLGSLQDVPVVDLGVTATGEALRRTGLAPEDVGELVFGHARQAGNGPNTNAEVAHNMATYNRNWYVNHMGGDNEQFAQMSDKQVNDFDKAYQSGESSFTSEGQKFVIGVAAAVGRFATDAQLQGHFGAHGGDFGAKTPAEYQQQADTFLNGPRGSGVLEKVRPNGDIVRYNPATEEFGVSQGNGTIRTYFKPDPSVHGYDTNLDYFNAQ